MSIGPNYSIWEATQKQNYLDSDQDGVGAVPSSGLAKS